MLCPKAEGWQEKFTVGNLFNIQPVHMGKRVMGKRASPVIQDGKETAVTASQAHFRSYFFVFFYSFFFKLLVSKEGKIDWSLFPNMQSPDVLCM